MCFSGIFWCNSIIHCSNKPTIKIIDWSFLSQWINLQNQQGIKFFFPTVLYSKYSLHNFLLYYLTILKEKKIKLWWALFVTYTIIQSVTSSEMCSLHLTHPSRAVGSRGAVGGSVPCSRVSPQSWTIPSGAEIRTHNLGLQVQHSIH